MGKRKNTHEFSDQYGESGPQDREDFGGGGGAGRGGGGGRGGGSAGRSRAGGVSLTFSRQLPKFLQAYAHMLPAGGPGGGDEDDPAIVDAARDSARAAAEREDEAEDDAAAEEEAIRRALEEDPTLAAQLGGEALARVRAGGEKEAGNRAFAAKDYDTAATHFTAAIELDPQNAVYYSNRSAALANLGRFEDALSDAKRAVKLKPGWVKGHARAGAAHMGLQQYGDAREAYERAVKLEPDDQTLRRALDKASALELQHIRDRKHVFKKAKPSGQQQQQQQRREQQRVGSEVSAEKRGGNSAADKAGKARSKLSFEEDEEDQL